MADYEYVVETGVIVPDTSATQDQVISEWRQAFGADLIVTPNTPQGLMIAAQTLARDNQLRNNAAVANQINPDLSGGIFLDALLALYGSERQGATRSYLLGVELHGAPGTVIPEGSQARVGTSGALFATTSAIVLAADGSGVAGFQALEAGPIAVSPGALDTIVTGVLGWDTVTNPTAAIPGTVEESDAAARRRRRIELGKQGTALPSAIQGTVYAVPGVRSVQFLENVAATTQTVEGISLVAHSIWVCVAGGADSDVAFAILSKKSLGANYNGTTTVNVTEPVTGQVYAVKFQRPDPVAIYAAFTVEQGTYVGDPTEVIKASVLAYANGEVDGEEGFQIAADVTAFELAGAVARNAPGLVIRDVAVGTTVSPTGTTVTIDSGEQAEINAAAITVTIV